MGENQDEHYGQGWTEEEEKVEIDYVGESCGRCGGMGHYARECPTPRGQGKGDVGKGKGKANGMGKPALKGA